MAQISPIGTYFHSIQFDVRKSAHLTQLRAAEYGGMIYIKLDGIEKVY